MTPRGKGVKTYHRDWIWARPVFCGAILAGITLLLWFIPADSSPPVAVDLDRVYCLSYAPARGGQDQGGRYFPAPAQMDEDLRILRRYTGRIRTYGVREGMEALPELARARGMKMIAGAWLQRDKASNEREIAALIEQARRYPDVIERVIVGNEVLLRRDMPPDQLGAYLRRVRQSVAQPVSYADVWEFWLKYPQLADNVDFITVHFLPYWEDRPVGVGKAAAHIRECYRTSRRAFPDKPVFIGETGWPTAGRPRGEAVPGRANAVRLINEFKSMAEKEGWDYSLFEAFDQHWKFAWEGPAGGHWGIMDQYRRPKLDAAGFAAAHSRRKGAYALFFFLSLLGVGAAYRPLPRLSFRNLVLYTLLSASLAGLWTAAWQRPFPAGVTIDSAVASAAAALQFLLAFFLLGETARHLDTSDPEEPGNGLFLFSALPGWLWAGKGIFAALILLSVARTGLFVLDGRYRDFPFDSFLVPAFGTFLPVLAVLAAGRSGQGTAAAPPPGAARGGFPPLSNVLSGATVVFGGILMILAAAVGYSEGLDNGEAVCCVAALVLFAFACPLWAAYGRSEERVHRS